MRSAIVSWAAASVAAHLVFLVLAAMSRMERNLDGGKTRFESPAPDRLEAAVRWETLPEFDSIAEESKVFAPPPTEEIQFERLEVEESDTGGCSRTYPASWWIDYDPVPPLDPRGWRGYRVPRSSGTPGDGAIPAALRWLVRNQEANGTWKAARSEFDVGVTALAVLALVRGGHGRSPVEVRSGVRALIERQDRDGLIGDRAAEKFICGHILATLALAETEYHDVIPSPTTRAVDFLLSAQNPGRGWRYAPKGRDNDTMVTAWAVLALRAAETATEGPAEAAYQDADAWFDEVTSEAYGRVGYTHRYTKLYWPQDAFDRHETCTAMAAAVRTRSESATRGIDLLVRDLPEWNGTTIDFMYWHAGTLAIRNVDQARGKRWEAWKAAALRAIVPQQRADGSWEPADRWSVDGGRAYATAMNALTLEALR